MASILVKAFHAIVCSAYLYLYAGQIEEAEEPVHRATG